RDCRNCLLKAQCCPKAPFRRLQRSIYEEAREGAREMAKTEAFERSRHDRKRVEMLFAHLKRILRLVAPARTARCPVRVYVSSDRAESSQIGQARRPPATAGRRMCGVSVRSPLL